MKGKNSYGLFRKMRYRDTTHRKNTCIWYGKACDRCATKNGWMHGRYRYIKSRPYGQCWFCGRNDFLNYVEIDHWSVKRANTRNRKRRFRRR